MGEAKRGGRGVVGCCRRVVAGGLGIGLLVPLALAVTSGPAAATTFTVTISSDSGAGSLRQAFVSASADVTGAHTIDVTPGLAPITLTTGELAYNNAANEPLTIHGNGNTVHQTTSAARVINAMSTGALAVDRFTVTGGSTIAGNGGGILSNGPVTITNSTISGNTVANSGIGGGIESNAAVTVTSSTVSGNMAVAGGAGTSGGAGIAANGTVTLTSSTVSSNNSSGSSGAFGGGILANTVTVTNSTISANTAGGVGVGGGFFAIATNGAAVVTGSTISANTASGTLGAGGGIAADGTVTVTNSTISGNTAGGAGGTGGGGGITAVGAVATAYATVVSNSAQVGSNVHMVQNHLTSFGSVLALPQGGGTNCVLSATPTISNGFNFSDDTSCGFTALTDRQNGGDPKLAALANNGGSTLTRLPQAGSPLIDAIGPTHCSDDGASTISPLIDQVGLARPQGAGCEIGAKEVAPAAASAATAPLAAPVVNVPRFTG